MIMVDVETSGLDPSRHAILSIGAVDFEHPDHQFYAECRIGPETAVDEAALQCNGFTLEDISNPSKPDLFSICRGFEEWCDQVRDRTLGGHNPHFDAGMLHAAFTRAGLEWPFRYRYVDSHSITYGWFLALGKQLPLKNGVSHIDCDTMLRFVGLFEEPLPHYALTGAKMEAEALYRMWLGKIMFDEYSEYPVPKYLTGFSSQNG